MKLRFYLHSLIFNVVSVTCMWSGRQHSTAAHANAEARQSFRKRIENKQ